MKQLITLSILLLGDPSLASAQETLFVTSGSMTHSLLSDYPYTIAGSGFSSSGDIMPSASEFDLPVGPGSNPLSVEGLSSNGEIIVSLTVHGVPWSYPLTTDAGVGSIFEATPIFGANPGIYHSTFTFFSDFIGGPVSAVAANPYSCDPFNCIHLNFLGSGAATWDLIPNPNLPGTLAIGQATFTFEAPEPSMTSLLLIGVAGLGVLGRRRRSRTTAAGGIAPVPPAPAAPYSCGTAQERPIKRRGRTISSEPAART